MCAGLAAAAKVAIYGAVTGNDATSDSDAPVVPSNSPDLNAKENAAMVT